MCERKQTIKYTAKKRISDYFLVWIFAIIAMICVIPAVIYRKLNEWIDRRPWLHV